MKQKILRKKIETISIKKGDNLEIKNPFHNLSANNKQNLINNLDNTIELKDLDSIKELGSGNFGFVNLVRSRKNKQLYAIKALNLLQIKKEKIFCFCEKFF